VDTGGLVLGTYVHAADLHSRCGGQKLLNEELRGELPRLAVVWVDGAYPGRSQEWIGEKWGWRVEVSRHPDRQLWRYGLQEKPRGFRVLPRQRCLRSSSRSSVEGPCRPSWLTSACLTQVLRELPEIPSFSAICRMDLL
jgi:hypothetical protein